MSLKTKIFLDKVIMMAIAIISFFLLSLSFSSCFSQIAPSIYWQFNNPTPLNPTVGGAAYNITPGTVTYSIGSGGPVGGYISQSVGSTTTAMTAGTYTPGSAVSFQFIFKPGRNFQKYIMGPNIGGNANVINVGSTTISFEYPYMLLFTKLASQSNWQIDYIELNGINKASWANLMDGNWHMISVVFNAGIFSGQRRVYIDGQSPSQFIINGSDTGTVNASPSPIEFQSTLQWYQYDGLLDEVAVYNGALTANQIWQNYLDFQAGNHFLTANSVLVPPYSPTTATYDSLEYGPGITDNGIVDVSPINQLTSFPKPRYAPIATGTDSLLNMPSCTNPIYNGGLSTYEPSLAQVNLNAAEISLYWAKQYNGVLDLWQMGNTSAPYTDTAYYPAKVLVIKNANPKLKLQAVSYLAQIDPNIPWDSRVCNPATELPTRYNVQNGSGNYVNENGVPCSNPPIPCVPGCGIARQWRPVWTTQQTLGYPDTGLVTTGKYYLTAVTAINSVLTPGLKVDYEWENNEVFKRLQDYVIDNDPVCNAGRIASGLDQWRFQSASRQRIEANYYNQFIGAVPATTGTRFFGYQVDGNQGNFMAWDQMRKTFPTYRGHKLPTTDFYPRYPSRWMNAYGPDHGQSWMRTNRILEYAQGDSICMPYISNGWDPNEFNNIAPPQWLGLIKILSAQGAEAYLPSTFSLGFPYPDPRNYIWNMVIPAYAQAITSRYEKYLHYGNLLAGDIPNSMTFPTDNSYVFNMGDIRSVCAIRKLYGANKYLIATTLQRNANMIGNTEDSVVRSVVLSGETLTMAVRQQGSVYIYDNSDPANKVFYQLDKWHEKTHPYWWTKDFYFEAEVNDNYTSPPLKTELRSGAPLNDYVGSTTLISYKDTAVVLDTIRFNFYTNTVGTRYGWVRARSRTGSATGVYVKMDAGASVFLPVVNTSWYWYRYDNGVVTPPGMNWSLTMDNHHLGLLPMNNLIEIDQVVLTDNPNAGYPEIVTGCTTTATITPSGTTTFCNGGSVTLTANANIAYLWSNGATTQSVTVTTSGTYNVTVTDGFGCTGISPSVVVTVNTIPTTPVVTITGSTTFCVGNSVILTSTAASGYLWSTGATTQSIAATTTGSYRVTVSNVSGCTASSATVSVTANALPAIPTITAGGATTFCSGGSVSLTSSAATSYQWNTGAITSAITVSTSGNYAVIVTNVNGCTRISASTTVTVNPKPIIASLVPVQNTCPAVTFDLSTLTLVNTGEPVTVISYHATFADATNNVAPIAAVVAGTATYYIRAQAANGCFAVVSQAVTIVSCLCATPPTANAGPDQTICSGTNATLAGAIGGSATVGTWTTSGTGTFSPNATTLNATYIPSAADTVALGVTLTLTTDNPLGAPCAADVNTMVLTINARPALTISATGATTFCTGGSVILAATAGATYIWNTGQTTQSILVSTAGTFNCTVTNAAGCTSGKSNSIAIIVNANPIQPNISASGPTTICNGSSVTLTSTLGTTYLWSTAATTQSISVSTSGSYRITITNAAGCTSSSAPTVVVVNPAVTTPVITPSGPTTFCKGSNVSLTSSSGDSYLWSTGEVTQSITTGTAGSYTVTVTIAGCTASSVATVVTTLNRPGASITNSGSNNICAGTSVTLTSNNAASYLWSTGASSKAITVNTTGLYQVTVTNSLGCSRISSPMAITVFPTITATITPSGATSFCQPGTVDLTATSGYNYLWSTGETTASITTGTNGNYTVTVMDGAGCTISIGPTKITAYPLPAVPVITPSSPISICASQTINLSSSAAAGYLWSNGSTAQTTSITTQGTYFVTVSDVNGCSRQSSPIIVVAGSAIAPVITASGPTTFCQGNTTVTLTSTAASAYLWSNGATSQAISTAITGDYIVTVTDSYGCTKSSVAKTVTVKTAPSNVVTVSGSLTFCAGGSVRLTAPSANAYLWNNGNTLRTITVTGTGSYRVTITAANGCTALSSLFSTFVNPNCTTACILGTGNGIKNIMMYQATQYWSDKENYDSTRVFLKKQGSSLTPRKSTVTNVVRNHIWYDLQKQTTYLYWRKSYCNGVATDSIPAKTFTTLSH